MTNEEKAREIAEFNYNEYTGYGGQEQISKDECEKSALEMAQWKDHQFKEYLEKKKEEYMLQRDNADMWTEQWAVFHALTCTMHQIINELFKEG